MGNLMNKIFKNYESKVGLTGFDQSGIVGANA